MTFEPQSLGLRTELFIAAREGSVTAAEGCLVIRNPDNPQSWFGNSLVLPGSPRRGDLARWEAMHVAAHPDAPHRVFQWDDVDGDVGDAGAFVEAGYELQPMEVMTTRSAVDNGKVDHGLDVRELTTDDAWEQKLALRMAIAVDSEGFTAESYRGYAQAVHDFQRGLVADSVARWYGVFEGDRVLATLGLVDMGPLARFQRVETHPDARRRGLCSGLVWHVTTRALAERPDRTLVMLAVADYHARLIYRSLGYVQTERRATLCKRPD